MACISLDRNLPPPSNEIDQTVEFPALIPEERPRHDSVAGCPICAAELADVDAGVRAIPTRRSNSQLVRLFITPKNGSTSRRGEGMGDTSKWGI